ncbi:MAG: hypothetical protein E6Q97_17540 [Desulfurellales bacterium]|nr:MAG: hypothetical protein E6Q97_17540 [Desulfurellales bacterium]
MPSNPNPGHEDQKTKELVLESESIFQISESIFESCDEILGPQLSRIAQAISADAAPGTDETGGHVNSLTEAVMGVTAGLCKIAEAIEYLADRLPSGPENYYPKPKKK